MLVGAFHLCPARQDETELQIRGLKVRSPAQCPGRRGPARLPPSVGRHATHAVRAGTTMWWTWLPKAYQPRVDISPCVIYVGCHDNRPTRRILAARMESSVESVSAELPCGP